MAVINGDDVRELWLVEFESRVFRRQPGQPVVDLSAGQDVKVGVHVWAVSGEEAVEIVKREVEKPGPESMPWLGFTGLQRVGLLESKIVNQPKAAPLLQPVRG